MHAFVRADARSSDAAGASKVYNTHKQTISDIENVVASETEQHQQVLSQLTNQHKQTINQIEQVVQAETQEHIQVLAQAEQNSNACARPPHHAPSGATQHTQHCPRCPAQCPQQQR